MRVLHILPTLGAGGAEILALRLMARSAPDLDHHVLCLAGRDRLSDEVAAAARSVTHLELTGGPGDVPAVARLARHVRRIDPDLVHGWLYWGSLAAVAATTWPAPQRPVLWAIHHTPLELAEEKRKVRFSIRACRALSHRPDRTLYVAEAARRRHHALGFRDRHSQVVPNGFTLAESPVGPADRQRWRAALGLPQDAFIVGFVGQYMPMKDPDNFLAAAARLAARDADGPPVHFALIGRRLTWANDALAAQIHANGLAPRVHLLAERCDAPQAMAAFDLLSLASAFGEAFPMVLGEAMAQGVPVAGTDVGDTAFLVGDTGWVVPPRDPEALAEAWAAARASDLARVGAAAHARIARHFSLDAVIAQYRQVYTGMLAGPREVHAAGSP